MTLKVLMLGWELPPFNSGGLGVACLGLARALVNQGAKITFVLPQKHKLRFDFMDLVFADLKEFQELVAAYTTSSSDDRVFTSGFSFVNQAHLFGERVRSIALRYQVDIIHCHDWLTFPAGIAAKRVLGKPLVSHVHSTEFDRTGGHYPNPEVFQIEKKGLEEADSVISVSNFTKDILVRKYGINSDKVNVVYNGVDEFRPKNLPPALKPLKDLGYKVVLYLGRITLHKGPEYFIRAAKRVSEYEPKVIFVVVGDGDMQERMMNEAANLGILDKVIFTGFLRGDEKDRIYQSADLYVMPSVSEPFGITPLESIANNTPVLISKQSGVSEVLNHVLKVDFWDTDEMANKILAVVRYSSLGNDLKRESGQELPKINWHESARKTISIYKQLI
ncbi:glycosyltransferase family 4 protein [Patescibacteria group bacterium]|nr:glycosyltransferase family 4 protein [Patescibacteria group bacterium]